MLKLPRLSTVALLIFVIGAWTTDPNGQLERFGRVVDQVISPARAQEGSRTFSPVKALAEPEVYYPGTEDLEPDEMRVL